MKAGDKIRLSIYRFGIPYMTEDFTVEEFRYCLGVFRSEQHRQAGIFTPLCDLYENGPDSECVYIPNFGEYYTNQVPAFMNIPS